MSFFIRFNPETISTNTLRMKSRNNVFVSIVQYLHICIICRCTKNNNAVQMYGVSLFMHEIFTSASKGHDIKVLFGLAEKYIKS